MKPYVFDPQNPWENCEFVLHKRDFKPRESMNLAGKPFEADLIQSYCRLLDEAFSFQRPPGTPEGTLAYMKDLAGQEHFIESFRAFWQEERLVGFYWLRENEVDKLVVSPACQGRGHGVALLTHALAEIFKRYEEACLTCLLQNERGLMFYRKYGMTVAE